MISPPLPSFLSSPLLIPSIAGTMPYQTGCSIILILQMRIHVQSANLHNLLEANHVSSGDSLIPSTIVTLFLT